MPRSVPAPHRIIENGRVVYGTGDPVPLDEAARLGLIEVGPEQTTVVTGPEQSRPAPRRRRGQQ